ncbi:endo-1,4-beta-xylanase [Echinimonas agarilytica]|uniref:Beta-xylanase n=1 Tax=Echinimonas agarilytica TaxID=1215918 RepID=A0AA41W8V7_9GAMM|nr:endo-1,4-beta-xylanase [Echinimonas agarilytica]MCM2681214.1 endo-1,4-beta-xylanase [Echinimonas agarilytica]
MQFKATIISTVAVLGLASCSVSQQETGNVQPTLKDAYKDSFMMGAALSKNQVLGNEPKSLKVVAREFNTVTAENEMKWEAIQPTEGTFTFESADALAQFSEDYDQFFVGHTLVWHHQTPDWVFEDEHGNPASKELVLKRMEAHINKVASRYAGQVDGWDVVNESLNDDGTWRESKWYQILGDQYIVYAFEMAQKAAPDTELYYNDYNLFKPEKRAGAVKIVKSLQAKGVRIDGVGIQGHYGIGYPDLNELEKSIQAFGDLGVKVMITELDISVLPFPDTESQGADVSIDLELQATLNPFENGLSPQMDQQLADAYQEIFELLLRHDDTISRVTFWGVNDNQTWRNDWPMKGRSDYPLLFDRQNEPKAAYQSVLKLKQ